MTDEATVPPESPVEVAPGVVRITCANPGPMTHTGTQTYVIDGGTASAVIDPGPEDAAHRAAILSALPRGAPLAAVLVTHSHRDHSPGAAPLARATGAPVLAFGPSGAGMSETMRRLAAQAVLGGGEGADRDFAPDRPLADGESVSVGEAGITALHTPGHLSNHLCLALDGTGLLFTGDTVMGWASTLVSPPDGDMGQFMASLARLEARAAAGIDRRYLPGHGAPVDAPLAAVRALAAHRRERAEQALAALAGGPATPHEMVARIYTDTDRSLWPAAERNLLATLIWLAEEGRVRCEGAPGPAARFALP